MIDIEDLKNEHSAEIALIILTCRVYFNTTDGSQIEEYIKKHPINWENFKISCALHSIRPVVYKTLLNASIPQKIKELMKKELLYLSAQSYNRAYETERIISSLKAKNIKVLPYKGSVFSSQFYGDLTSRESSDIDLAILKEDLEDVIKFMEADGYHTDNFSYNFLGSKYYKEYKDLSFNKYKNRTRLFHVEFHWAVAERFFTIDKQGETLFKKVGNEINILRESIVPINVNEHFVAQMINHVWRDVFKNLKALVDLGVCIQDRNGLLNWKEVDQLINDLKLKKGYELFLALADQLLGIKNDNNSSYSVSDKTANLFKKSLLRTNPTGRIPFRSRTFILCQLSLRENSYDNFIFLKEYIRKSFYPSETDLKLIKLPNQFFFLYSLLKPIRYLFKRPDPMERKKRLIPDE